MALDRRPIRQRLADLYTEAELMHWMHTSHPQLGGRTPAQAILSGAAGEVHAILDRLSDGAHL
jgi:uncharacterized protein (DUF2384 family)